MCVFDVFASRQRPLGEKEPCLGELVFRLANQQRQLKSNFEPILGTQNFFLVEDHALEALLIATSFQFPDIVLLHSADYASHEEKIKKLKYHIMQTQTYNYWKPIPGAFLWCLMVAIDASKGLPENNFFVAHMLRATIGVAFELVEPVRIALATFYKLRLEQREKQRARQMDI